MPRTEHDFLGNRELPDHVYYGAQTLRATENFPISGVFLHSGKRASYYVASRAHHADVGGISPGSMPMAREIYQEGIRIPPILLVRAGRIDHDLMGLQERRADSGLVVHFTALRALRYARAPVGQRPAGASQWSTDAQPDR